MKTKEEPNALIEIGETLNRKLAELTEEELAQAAGSALTTSGAGYELPGSEPTSETNIPPTEL